MTSSDADRWNERYLSEGEAWLKRSPRRLLIEYADLLPDSGLALDAASGVSVNGLFLAERGLHVIALDISEVGLRLALREAKARNLALDAAVTDLLRPWLPCECLDVILNFRFLSRAIIPQYQRALRAGGLLFFETFLNAADGTSHREYYLEPGELRQAFQGWETMHWSTKEAPSRGSGVLRRTERIVTKKP